MNLTTQIQDSNKPISVQKILQEQGKATLIKIAKDKILEKHHSKTNALVVLLTGKAIYEEEERTILLENIHDFVEITAHVTHRVIAKEDTLLLLIQG